MFSSPSREHYATAMKGAFYTATSNLPTYSCITTAEKGKIDKRKKKKVERSAAAKKNTDDIDITDMTTTTTTRRRRRRALRTAEAPSRTLSTAPRPYRVCAFNSVTLEYRKFSKIAPVRTRWWARPTT